MESEVRVAAQVLNIRSLMRTNGTVIFHIGNLKKAEPLFRNAKKLIKVVDSNELYLTLPGEKMSPHDSANFVRNLLNQNT